MSLSLSHYVDCFGYWGHVFQRIDYENVSSSDKLYLLKETYKEIEPSLKKLWEFVTSFQKFWISWQMSDVTSCDNN